MTWKRLPIVALLIAPIIAALSSARAAPQAEADKRPNVLFLMVDDLNDWIEPMDGHPQARTLNIDRLASRGTTFLNAHCPAPICGPSRAALWTGLRPSTTGLYLHINDRDIMDNLPRGVSAEFLPDALEDAGYHTLGAGKLFHRGDGAGVFDEYGPGFNFGSRPSGGQRLNFDPAWLGPSITSTDWGAFPESVESMPDYAIREWALDQLEGDIPEPFFMGVGFVRPHVPWYVPQKWFDKFDRDELETPAYVPNDLADVPPIGRLIHGIPGYPTTEWARMAGEWQAIVEAYLASAAFADHQVGLVLDALENSPYADNTVVVLMGDHGYHLGEKNRFAKMALWERSTRVPLIVAKPGGPEGLRVREPANLLDLYPTILEMTGVEAPTDLEGRSLARFVNDPDAAPTDHAVVTTHGRNNHAVRSRHYRYIRYENGAEELYDHRDDPWEHHNLAGNPEHADVIDRLSKHLPENDAPLAEDSHLGVNQYFQRREPIWRQP